MVEDESRGAFEEREDGKGGIVPPDFVMHIPELRWARCKTLSHPDLHGSVSVILKRSVVKIKSLRL